MCLANALVNYEELKLWIFYDFFYIKIVKETFYIVWCSIKFCSWRVRTPVAALTHKFAPLVEGVVVSRCEDECFFSRRQDFEVGSYIYNMYICFETRKA